MGSFTISTERRGGASAPCYKTFFLIIIPKSLRERTAILDFFPNGCQPLRWESLSRSLKLIRDFHLLFYRPGEAGLAAA
jgi:hypothetical protein